MRLHDMEWELCGDGYVSTGDLVFDYVSHILPTSKHKPLGHDLFEHICYVLTREGTDVAESSTYSALRMVASSLFLTGSQLFRILQCFEDRNRRIDLYCELYCRCVEFG